MQFGVWSRPVYTFKFKIYVIYVLPDTIPVMFLIELSELIPFFLYFHDLLYQQKPHLHAIITHIKVFWRRQAKTVTPIKITSWLHFFIAHSYYFAHVSAFYMARQDKEFNPY